MYGFCGEYGGMVSITPYGMVWYVSKHMHKDNSGTFGSVVERLETLWKTFGCVSSVLGAYRSV